MILLESNEQAVNFYNKLTGTKDGKRFVSSLIHNGFPRNDLMWAVKVIVKEGIPDYELIDDYRQWKEYAIPFYQDSQGKNIISLPKTHEQMIKDIDDALNYYQHLNVIYDDGTTSIMPICTFHHASLLPPEIKKPWCICKQEHRFNEFFPQCGAYLLITDVSLQEPYRNVIAIVNNNTTEYWDSNNQRMSEVSQEEEQRLVQYEQMLKPEVVERVNTYKINENKTYKNMKKNIQRINENQLRAIVAESVKKVLRESEEYGVFDALSSDRHPEDGIYIRYNGEFYHIPNEMANNYDFTTRDGRREIVNAIRNGALDSKKPMQGAVNGSWGYKTRGFNADAF